ncbi:aromatic ring-hydroxylating dioxygenase subunit alpha [Paraburkholderia agricolaris]|uniref:Aromatic ring-hydroxylating dioxygenase subunit alpha n=1 Tax=Paraburkholderia agricolaris TaxID=2152888 RepID=A0ABW8ZX67_9BURK
MAFLRNYWYVAATADEIPAMGMLGRRICGESVVLFRGEDGRARALEDRCCHRRYPLSKGSVEGCSIRCGYHGMVFNAEGQCTEIPGQPTIPKQAYVKRYQVIERHRWIWIWIGDEENADPTNIPDYHWFDDPQWRGKSTRFHVRANFKLIVENLLDLSHLAFVHTSTIGNRAVVDSATVSFDRGDNEVRVNRWMRNVPPPPSYRRASVLPFERVDRWQIIHFMPPAFCRLYVGAMKPGMTEDEVISAEKMEWLNLNAVTPETETTTHYFWGQVHNHDLDKPELTELIFKEVEKAFLEDRDVFEEQQKAISEGINRTEVNTFADVGALHAVRIIDRLLREQDTAMGQSITPDQLSYGPHW